MCVHWSVQQLAEAASLTKRLFNIFDADGNGVVDKNELKLGMSLLSPGTHKDKIKAAFDVFGSSMTGHIVCPPLQHGRARHPVHVCVSIQRCHPSVRLPCDVCWNIGVTTPQTLTGMASSPSKR
jgi:hypothetical protein